MSKPNLSSKTQNTPSDSPVIEVTEMVIARDKCEKDPLDGLFPPGVAIEPTDLRPTGGDYSLKGHEKLVGIERKSLPDLLGTLWGSTELADGSRQPNLGRFAYELQKMSAMELSYVAVEGTRDDLKDRISMRARVCARFGKKQHIDFQRTMGLISSLQAEFGVVFAFFRDRMEMAQAIYTDLYHCWRRFEGLSRSKIGRYADTDRVKREGLTKGAGK